MVGLHLLVLPVSIGAHECLDIGKGGFTFRNGEIVLRSLAASVAIEPLLSHLRLRVRLAVRPHIFDKTFEYVGPVAFVSVGEENGSVE